jgi:hypothetical protein
MATMSPDEIRIAKQVLKKAIREQPKPLAIGAVWRFVQKLADANRYRDGFVEWFLVVEHVEDVLGDNM